MTVRKLLEEKNKAPNKSLVLAGNAEPTDNKVESCAIAHIHPPVLAPPDAALYLGIRSKGGDPLKSSRSTGLLWGVPAPSFIKAGASKIIYPVLGLDEFLARFKIYRNNAEVGHERIA